MQLFNPDYVILFNPDYITNSKFFIKHHQKPEIRNYDRFITYKSEERQNLIIKRTKKEEEERLI